jgi:hypothetical protein
LKSNIAKLITSSTVAAIASPTHTIVSQRSARFNSAITANNVAGRAGRSAATVARSVRAGTGSRMARPLALANSIFVCIFRTLPSIYEATRFRLQKN